MKASNISESLPKAKSLSWHYLYFFVDIKTDYCENIVFRMQSIKIPVGLWNWEEVDLFSKLSEWIHLRVVHLNLIDQYSCFKLIKITASESARLQTLNILQRERNIVFFATKVYSLGNIEHINLKLGRIDPAKSWIPVLALLPRFITIYKLDRNFYIVRSPAIHVTWYVHDTWIDALEVAWVYRIFPDRVWVGDNLFRNVLVTTDQWMVLNLRVSLSSHCAERSYIRRNTIIRFSQHLRSDVHCNNKVIVIEKHWWVKQPITFSDWFLVLCDCRFLHQYDLACWIDNKHNSQYVDYHSQDSS